MLNLNWLELAIVTIPALLAAWPASQLVARPMRPSVSRARRVLVRLSFSFALMLIFVGSLWTGTHTAGWLRAESRQQPQTYIKYLRCEASPKPDFRAEVVVFNDTDEVMIFPALPVSTFLVEAYTREDSTPIHVKITRSDTSAGLPVYYVLPGRAATFILDAVLPEEVAALAREPAIGRCTCRSLGNATTLDVEGELDIRHELER